MPLSGERNGIHAASIGHAKREGETQRMETTCERDGEGQASVARPCERDRREQLDKKLVGIGNFHYILGNIDGVVCGDR